MSLVARGADVSGPQVARLLRRVEAKAPEFIEITEPMGRYSGVGHVPYFGAILTAAGRKAIRMRASGAAKCAIVWFAAFVACCAVFAQVQARAEEPWQDWLAQAKIEVQAQQEAKAQAEMRGYAADAERNLSKLREDWTQLGAYSPVVLADVQLAYVACVYARTAAIMAGAGDPDHYAALAADLGDLQGVLVEHRLDEIQANLDGPAKGQ